MKTFVSRHAAVVTCVLSGFDRLVFRGTLLPLVRERGMHVFLSRAKVRLLDFKAFAMRTSERVKEVALAEAQRRGRPVRYPAPGRSRGRTFTADAQRTQRRSSMKNRIHLFCLCASASLR